MTSQKKKSSILLFFSYYKPHWKLFAVDMFFACVIAAVDLSFPVLTRFTMQKLLPNQLFRFFFLMIALMVMLYLLRSAATWLVTYIGHLFGSLVEADMRRDLFLHIEKQPFAFFDKNRTGHIMSRLTYDLFEITELAHHGPEDVFQSMLTLIGSFIIMFSIRWELAVTVTAVVPLMIFITSTTRKSMTETSRRVKEKTAEINASLESCISGIRVTKIFTNEDYEKMRFGESNAAHLNAKAEYQKAMAGFHFKTEFFTHILFVIVLACGGILIMRGSMQVSDIVAANLFITAFLQPIRRLTNFAELFTTGTAGFHRFRQLMDTNEQIYEKPNAEKLSAVRGDISYEHITFGYGSRQVILSDLSFSIQAGQTVALVGPSGGGKTTICHLLPRFYDITSGRIAIDGTDIRDITLKSLRQQIGLVQQDVFLFAGTVRENIAYGKLDATDEEIIEAATRAEMHNDIMKMPDGYNTMVGEHGIKLSGGQKQRISIARIFLKNPPILILDEATSALDTETEIHIQHSFDELSKGRTTLVIAHRLSTIRSADKILVIDNGQICESGTHEQLIAKNGLYKKLHDAQFKAFS
ncbi:MAG: ABC transporter ATP-binding protein/permease [Bacteroides sp.]|nr:ABC transporter ATP-binding protein/permease [Prevotella sp.]MCM1408068.1 ABC transporter ATP-binding protein/permease [Treponema brennaborense]MCM1469044.1 ABC transporter ATP-binding protein/permease [Bacteroides sp.]